MSVKNYIGRWLEKRRLEKEELEEIRKWQREERKKKLIKSLKEKIAQINKTIDNTEFKIKKCRNHLKELLRRKDINNEIVMKRAQLCLLRMKMRDYFEQIVEIWDQAIEQIDILNEFGDAIFLLKDSAKLFEESVVAYETNDLHTLGISMRRMNRVLERITNILDIHLKIPSIQMDPEEVNSFLAELKAEVVAEEAQRLKPIPGKEREYEKERYKGGERVEA